MDKFIFPLRQLAGAAQEALLSATGSAVCPEPFLDETEVAPFFQVIQAANFLFILLFLFTLNTTNQPFFFFPLSHMHSVCVLFIHLQCYYYKGRNLTLYVPLLCFLAGFTA